MASEVGVVVAFADQLDERVDRHQRILDLVGDAGHHAREELELVGLALLRRQFFLGGEVLEHEDGAQGCALLVADDVGRHLDPQAPQRQLDLRARHGPTRRQRVEQEIAQRRGQDAQILTHDGVRGQAENLLGSSVHGADALITADRDHAARHVREDPLGELLFPLELLVQRDVADDRGELGDEVEERLDLRP